VIYSRTISCRALGIGHTATQQGYQIDGTRCADDTYHQGHICDFGITKPPSCSMTSVMMTLHRDGRILPWLIVKGKRHW
jgi:hypothetical protein